MRHLMTCERQGSGRRRPGPLTRWRMSCEGTGSWPWAPRRGRRRRWVASRRGTPLVSRVRTACGRPRSRAAWLHPTRGRDRGSAPPHVQVLQRAAGAALGAGARARSDADPRADAIPTTAPTVIAPGMAVLPPPPSMLFWPGYITEQALVVTSAASGWFYERVRSRDPRTAWLQHRADRIWAAPKRGLPPDQDTEAAITATGFRIQARRRFDFQPCLIAAPAGPPILGRAIRE